MLLDYENVLNKEQLEAINIINGPLVVYAGAGTGKTRTLTYRIIRMLDEGISPSNILAITFTKKAANEMLDRVASNVGYLYSKACTICTIHALCAKILRRDIDHLGFDRSFLIIDEDDQLKVINECIEELDLDKKTHNPKRLRRGINAYKAFGEKPRIPIEMKIYDLYDQKMRELNQLDFVDLLIKVEELFMRFPQVLEKYQDLYKYILVDEFQDTDTVQYHIISMLANKYRNLFLVGDDDQSIYSFRGTNYENIKKFKREFPEYKSIVLSKNYRSTQFILDGCNRLISKNVNREPKSLVSDTLGDQSDVSVVQALDERDEVNFIVNKIIELHKQGYPYKDFAILYRANSISHNFETGLTKERIPYRLYGGVAYMLRREIKDMSAYFRLICNPYDKASFKRIVNVPSRGIGSKTVEKIFEFAHEFKCSVWDAIDKLKVELKNKYGVLKEFANNIFELSDLIETVSYNDIFDQIITRFDFYKSIEGEDDEEERRDNLEEYRSILVSFDDSGIIGTQKEKLQSCIDEAVLSVDKFSRLDANADQVTVSTIHSAKGLEFRFVFVVALEEGIFPSMWHEDDVDEEEERRIAYVAVTRAKEKLFLTCATERLIYGTRQRNKRSRFLVDFITGSSISSIKRETLTPPRVDRTLPNETDFHVGEKIEHKIFGEGIIVSLNKTIGTVCFVKSNEIKVLDMTHPSITKKE